MRSCHLFYLCQIITGYIRRLYARPAVSRAFGTAPLIEARVLVMKHKKRKKGAGGCVSCRMQCQCCGERGRTCFFVLPLATLHVRPLATRSGWCYGVASCTWVGSRQSESRVAVEVYPGPGGRTFCMLLAFLFLRTGSWSRSTEYRPLLALPDLSSCLLNAPGLLGRRTRRHKP
jgi:hypothetical protein